MFCGGIAFTLFFAYIYFTTSTNAIMWLCKKFFQVTNASIDVSVKNTNDSKKKIVKVKSILKNLIEVNKK